VLTSGSVLCTTLCGWIFYLLKVTVLFYGCNPYFYACFGSAAVKFWGTLVFVFKRKKHGLDRGSVVNQEMKSSGMGSKMVLKNINSEKYLSIIQLNYSSRTASIL